MQCPTNASARPSILLTNTSVPTTAWTSDTTYSGYTKRADISVTGATADMSASVVYGNVEASSGNYAPFCVTGANKVSIYCRTAPSSAITIPTVKVDQMITYTTLDNAPMSGSTLPVTSGGVYDALLNQVTVETRDIKSKLTNAGVSVSSATLYKCGKIGIIAVSNMSVSTSYVNISVLNTGETTINSGVGVKMFNVNSGTYVGEFYINNGLLNIEKYGSNGTFYGSFFFMFA